MYTDLDHWVSMGDDSKFSNGKTLSLDEWQKLMEERVENSGGLTNEQVQNIAKIPTLSSQLDEIDKKADYSIAKSRLSFRKDKLGFYSINIIGDSISHGCNCPNIYDDGWTAILRKALQIEYDSENYGYVNLLSPLYSGSNSFKDLLSFNHGTWTRVNNPDTLGFMKIVSTDSSSVSIGTFNKKVNAKKIGIGVIKDTNSGNVDFSIKYVGETLENTTTINLNNVSLTQDIIWITASETKLIDTIKFSNKTGVNQITGIYLIDNIDKVVINNFSRSGAKLSDMSDYLIDNIFDTNVLFFCLGHNGGDNLDLYFQKFKNAYDKYKPIMYVCDYTWTNSRSTIADRLKDLATYCNAQYIEIVDRVVDAQMLIDKGFLDDVSHPTVSGHKQIAETILAKIKTTFLSKNSINKYKNLSSDIENKLNTQISILNGRFDCHDVDYQYFKDIKCAIEIKVTKGSVTDLYIGRPASDSDNNWYLFPSKDSTQAISQALEKRKGEWNFIQPAWVTETNIEGKISLGDDIMTIFSTIPVGKKIKLINAITSSLGSNKLSLIEFLKYGSL